MWSSGACPADAFEANTVPCTGSSQGGACDDDTNDRCSGTANTCEDAFKASSVECRADTGQCDVAELCTGSSGACPADAFEANTVPCTGSSQGGACDDDTNDRCSGSADTCDDAFKASGQTCDAGMALPVLTCEGGTCGTCVPVGTCSTTTTTTCAFDEECPGVETCNYSGPGDRFVDNGDDTVTDRRTCLVWEQKTGTYDASFNSCPDVTTCPDPHEVDNLYTWSTGAPWNFDGSAKTAFLDVLNTATFAGHGDWRLPRVSRDADVGFPELESILLAVCPGGGAPCIDSIFIDPPIYGTAAIYYWSATTYAPFPDVAWFVDFNNGFVDGNYKTNGYYVRAVRGGS